ncbi:hypothetical protein CHS0354_013600 [Potamilus streckersoni]|uniref:Uncharacterized protein n=1 Tax=Potamilus streckersoni TaxID=2493646 RepID=A0AAE0SKN2_9BIVA|nr:hypothetical protein CHS0354_013600 [Potamilus streckersoni]
MLPSMELSIKTLALTFHHAHDRALLRFDVLLCFDVFASENNLKPSKLFSIELNETNISRMHTICHYRKSINRDCLIAMASGSAGLVSSSALSLDRAHEIAASEHPLLIRHSTTSVRVAS